jgi:serine/threonine-protein kinase
VLYQCLTGQQPYPGNTLEQIAVGHMVAPPPRPSEKTAPSPTRSVDDVIAIGLAKSLRSAIPPQLKCLRCKRSRGRIQRPVGQSRSPAAGWSEREELAAATVDSGGDRHTVLAHPRPYPHSAPTQFSGPHSQPQPPRQPPPPKRSGHRNGILVGALVFVATLVLVAGVVAFIEVTQHDDSGTTAPSPSTAAAVAAVEFSG